MSRVVAIAIGIVVLAAAAAGGWYYFNGTEEPGAAGQSSAPAETSEERAAAPDNAEPGTGEDEPAAARTEGPFEAQRVQVNTKSDEPEACLVFNRRLDDTGETKYQDYIRVSPRADYGVYAEDVFLCLTGLDYARSYSVTVREGLPSATGEKTAADQTLPVELKDRPAAVHFGQGLILPRQVAKGVPVATVNVERLKIRIYRVGDRILARMRYHVLDERTISEWERNSIANDEGALVWEGEMDVAPAGRNETVETLFPFREAVPGDKPGAYLVVAEDAKEEEEGRNRRGYRRMAGQWVIDSDLGLTSFSGADGLHLYVRSLRTAQPLSGVRLTLIAQNNEILGEARTDGQGAVKFDKGLTRGEGGMTPVAVMAYGPENDFNYLDLRRPAHDLSDRGVGGRAVPGPVDAYVYLDRGIYRPGETVHAVTMLRDRKATALEGAPLTLVIRRPDGIEYRKLVLNDQKAGAAHAAVELSRSAPRGWWQAIAYTDPEGDPVGRAGFAVQDFVPERLKVTVEPQTERFTAGEEVALDVTARFLYGAPAVGLEGEAELTLSRDPEPFPEHKAYRFGRVTESVPNRVVKLDMTDTDEEGRATVTGKLDVSRRLTNPLRAAVRVSVFEPGGRSTDETVSVPVRTGDVLLGVKDLFDGSSVAEGAEAGFEVIAVDGEGGRIARERVGFKLVRIAYRYQWFFRGNQWRYEWTSTESVVEQGAVEVTDGTAARVKFRLDPGSYRFEVADKASGAATSTNFYVGWWSGGRQGPDNVAVVADKQKYKPGETARLTVTPPVAGKALIVVARDRMFESRLVDLPREGRTIDVKVSEDWGSGAYVLVTAYRPLAEGSPRAPVRAVGVSWLQVDQSGRTFEVTVEGPEKAEPETTVTVPVSVRSGGKAPKSAWVTLAAVDEGILQLTDFSSPSPEDYYYAKLRLALDMRDDYGRLIEASDAIMGEIRSGGGAAMEAALKRAMGGGLDVIPTRTVALFSGIVELDENGKAQVPVEIPDFAGELRLMAVAFSADALGSGARPLTVRRDVVGEMTLPRFLAPGDTADANLSLHNVEGPAGTYRAEVKLTGAAAAEGETAFDVELGEGQRRDLPVGVTGSRVGIGTIRLTVTGPNDFTLEREWSIQVRPAQPPVISSTVARLQPGESLTLNADTHADRVPGTAAVSLTLSQTPAYDVPGLLRALDRYPYGCLEQTTSRAFPLLFFTDLSLLVNRDGGLEEERSIRRRVNQAVSRILDMQRADGGFGMWSFQGERAFNWLSVFALDFLTEAKARNYFVPEDPLGRGMDFLDRITGVNRDHEIQAYAYYVLAKAGKANLGDLRYFHDNHGKRLEDAMSHALLGAALDLSGDRARGADAFRKAADLALDMGEDYKPVRYGSRLRDVSGVIALAARSGRHDMLPRLLDLANGLDRTHRYTTTQEKTWMLMAAHALSEGGAQPELEVDGQTRAPDGPVVTLTPDIGEVDAGYTVKNTGGTAIWYVLTVDGVPREKLPAVSEGVTLTRSFFTLEGEPADLSRVRQNGRLVVVLEGEVESGRWWGREMVLLDLLPAGFDIEAPVRDNKLYPWLKPAPSHAAYVAAQDDRFVASFRTRWSKKGEKDSFKQVYVVRAVTPGRYVVPPAAVEDMYAPRIRARTGAAELTVVGANEPAPGDEAPANGPEDDGE